jgi:integrase
VSDPRAQQTAIRKERQRDAASEKEEVNGTQTSEQHGLHLPAVWRRDLVDCVLCERPTSLREHEVDPQGGDAQDALTDRLGLIQKGVPVNPKVGKITVHDALKAVVDNLKMNGRRSVEDAQRRIDNHLLTFFAADRRMSTITTGDLERYQAHRLVEQKAKPATVNRELAAMRRAFRLARRGGELISIPDVPMLRENNTRTGFFERDQFDAILKHLPTYLHPLLEFMYVTGWRKAEVLTLTVSQVVLAAGIVRLEPGTTKNDQGRSFFVTTALRELLEERLKSIEALKKKGVITPFIFHRPDGTEIKSFRKLWEKAREAAGYHRLLHDLRRTAVRSLERRRSTHVGHEDGRAQDGVDLQKVCDSGRADAARGGSEARRVDNRTIEAEDRQGTSTGRVNQFRKRRAVISESDSIQDVYDNLYSSVSRALRNGRVRQFQKKIAEVRR